MDCVVCQSLSKTLYSDLTDKVHTNISGSYTLRQCLSCSLLFINPAPSPEKLMEHYPEDNHVYERQPLKLSSRKAWIMKLIARHYLGYGKPNRLMQFLYRDHLHYLMH